jgi:chitinase
MRHCNLVLKAFFILLFLANCCVAQEAVQIIGYVFPQQAVLNPSDIKAEELTRINYAFANLKGGRVVEGFSHDRENFAMLNGLKTRNPGLKILVSVGGWTWSGAFSDAALTKESRRTFVESAVAFVAKYNLDGFDIDWEYPGLIGNGNVFRLEDKNNYTALLKELRQSLNREGVRLKRRLYLSVATGANADFVSHTELAKVANEVDSINLMSYDYYEPTDDKIAGHHAPLFTNPADPKQISADASVRMYLAAGVPAAKIVLGVPFYGHAWTTTSDVAHGLYQPAAGAHIPTDFHDVTAYLAPATGYGRYWDSVASAPYLYNSITHVFISYDDPESLNIKCAYVLKHKLGGVMFWDYSGDSNGLLLYTLHAALVR